MDAGLQPLIEFLHGFTRRMRTDIVALYHPPGPRDKRGRYEPRESGLSDEDLERHLTSQQPAGLYLLEPSRPDTCAIAVVDIDDKKKELTWPELCLQGQKVAKELLARGMVAWPCRSGSGHGVHLWIFFEQPQPAGHIRQHMKAAVKAAGLTLHVDYFPGQDVLPNEGKGSLVALPLSRASRPIRDLTTGEVREDLSGMLPSPPVSPPVRDPAQGGSRSAAAGAPKKKSEYGEVDAATLDEALSYIENSQYETWRDVGLALKRAVEDGQLADNLAQGAWERWSATAGNFDGRAQDYQWMRMKPDGSLTLGTVWKLAKDKGWKGGGGRQPTGEVPPEILELNKTHFICEEGNRVFIFREDYDKKRERHKLTRLNQGDFKLKHHRKKIVVGYNKKGVAIHESLGTAWIDSEAGRGYDEIVMEPNGAEPRQYNLWKGWSIEPSEEGSCELFKRHLLDNLCRGNKEAYEYLMNWCAQSVQRPGEPIGVAVVLRGDRGTGKGTFARTFGSLFGQHFIHIFSSKSITGQFNAHLRDCVLLFADEAVWAGSKQEESILKGIITEPDLPIEGKGRDLVTVSNMIHMIISTNNEWSVPAGLDERRFFALHVNEDKKQDTKYFNAILKELREGGKARWLWELLHRDLTGFDVFNVPQTEELARQKLLSMEPWMEWWYERLRAGEPIEGYAWGQGIPIQALYLDYVFHCRMAGHRQARGPEYLSRCLKGLLPKEVATERRRLPHELVVRGEAIRQGSMQTFWLLPSLEACRVFMEAKARTNLSWDVLRVEAQEPTRVIDDQPLVF